MTDDDKREIVQLWWVAEKYFKMTKEVREDLSDDDLQTTVEQLTKRCQRMADIKGTTALLMKLNAHLASCAIRLYSIDEKLRGCSKRWRTYKKLAKKEDTLTEGEVQQEVSCIVHFLLRQNVCHEEDCPAKKRNIAYDTMQKTFKKLIIGELYKNMRLVRDEIEAELKKKSIIGD